MILRKPFSAVVLVAFLLGCARQSPPPPAPGMEGEPVGQGAEPGDGSWMFRFKEHGFTIRLPSSNWKEHKRKTHLADFWCNPLGVPMLAAVTSAKKQSNDEYRESVKWFQKNLDNTPDLVVAPVHQEGTTREGNPFAFSTACERGAGGAQYLFVASSYTWLKDKSLTVVMVFEGQGKMRSHLLKSVEYSEFEKTAKAVCLSVEQGK